MHLTQFLCALHDPIALVHICIAQSYSLVHICIAQSYSPSCYLFLYSVGLVLICIGSLVLYLYCTFLQPQLLFVLYNPAALFHICIVQSCSTNSSRYCTILQHQFQPVLYNPVEPFLVCIIQSCTTNSCLYCTLAFHTDKWLLRGSG